MTGPKYSLWVVAAVSAFGALRCSPEHTVLWEGGASSAGGSGSPDAGLPVGGAGGGAGTSHAVGAGGSIVGTGGTGIATGGSSLGGTTGTSSCAVHADCPYESLCTRGGCAPCADVSCDGVVCPFAFVPTLVGRNGCVICECVPPSECTHDDDCQLWEICYPGAQCQEGCTEPTCCFGNRCGQPGCPSLVEVSCVVAGCYDGGKCLSECEHVECECNGASWQCSSPGGGGTTASASCAWACTAP